MININEYAQLSQDIYGQPFRIPSYKNIDFISKKYNGWGRIENVDSSITPASNFFAGLYIKFRAGVAEDAVIAFRGTVFSNAQDLFEDVVSWYSSALGTGMHDRVPGYFKNAVNFESRARQYLRDHFPKLAHLSHLRYTGHSLGGALAQLLSVTNFPVPSVSFNSPSCRNICPKSSEERWGLVNNINSRYDILNKLGGVPIGKTHQINIPQFQDEAKALLAHFNEKRFSEGRALEQIGGSISKTSGTAGMALSAEGTVLEVEGYAGSLSGLVDAPHEQAEAAICAKVEEFLLSGTFSIKPSQANCNSLVTVISAPTAIEAIMAQHSIDNMLSTLSEHSPEIAGLII